MSLTHEKQSGDLEKQKARMDQMKQVRAAFCPNALSSNNKCTVTGTYDVNRCVFHQKNEQ